MFFNMMRKFSKVRFIWRWKGDVPEESPPNLLGVEWLPQKEILSTSRAHAFTGHVNHFRCNLTGHPKLRGFMSHCGLNSIIEAICVSAPVICVPLFLDQDFNANRILAQELGVNLELKGVTQEIMDATVEKLLSNPK